MYQVTKISIEILTIDQLKEARDAIKKLQNLDIQEVDVDVRQLINGLISRKESTRV